MEKSIHMIRLAAAAVIASAMTACAVVKVPKVEDLQVFGHFHSRNDTTLTTPVYIAADLKERSIQSVSLDRKRGLLRTLTNQHDRMKVFDFSGNLLTEVHKPHTGHNNDMCYVDDKLWVVGTKKITEPQLWLYDIPTNTAVRQDVTAVRDWGRDRDLSGVCDYDDNTLLLVARENMKSTRGANQPGDMMGIYKMDKGTGQISQWFELPWRGIFVQGITYVNGYLFVATNMLYKIHGGMSIWVIDTRSQKLVDEMIIYFDGEAEGLDYNFEKGKLWLYVGLGSPAGKFAYVGKFKSMYQ